MGVDMPAVEPQEFESWVRPQDLLARLSALPRDAVKDGIAHRIQDGRIRTAARQGTTPRRGSFDLEQVHVSIWKQWAFSADHAFWSIGDSVLYYQGGRAARLYGVRLHPGDIEESLQDMMVSPASAEKGVVSEGPATARPAVSQADLDRWAKLFVQLYDGQITEARAILSARSMFPGHAISRDRVRALLPARPVGRPATREKGGK